ncbi:ankyrin repeat domain-containing protein 46-like [Mytilus galloprovincialis]|uniref:Uncharacterized protein n=1 Tax=Mytilus galloprovincialis TaxID=29158 RepID=A0A8B6FRW2_MYTGA|nr:Hypothetical predicted protein [Mytilus galloprovincialis]
MESIDHMLDMMEIGNDLQEAVLDGNVDLTINLLESRKFDLNKRDKQGRTLLHYAACRGQYEIVELLLEQGAKAHLKDKNGNTPLHWCGHAEVIDLLINQGAKVDDRNCIGATPKEMAKRRGVPRAVLQVFDQYKKEEEVSQNNLKTLFHEFSEELGIKNLLLLILLLLFISVYAAYTITGLSSHLKRANPIVV